MPKPTNAITPAPNVVKPGVQPKNEPASTATVSTPTAYQQNLQQPVKQDKWYAGDYPTSREMLGRIYSIYHEDKDYGQKLLVTAQNRTRQDITVLGLRVHPEDEDAYGVYVSSTPLAAVTVPAGTKEPKNIWFYLIDDRDNEEALEILRRAYTLELLYVDASTGYTRLADVPSDVLQAETIRSEGRATAFQTLTHVSSTVASRE